MLPFKSHKDICHIFEITSKVVFNGIHYGGQLFSSISGYYLIRKTARIALDCVLPESLSELNKSQKGLFLADSSEEHVKNGPSESVTIPKIPKHPNNIHIYFKAPFIQLICLFANQHRIDIFIALM
ncbi:hypothetical protein RF11_16298 [Thelohanellus kitauei]|uniref:Uncharacterized protein n=1 Tax=Thelohanellus kitauei TaxID=669202 RepID=A0A0C2JH86_THEKT|nr:hypothetical protein RF11_16298 [Thelohanellus kitauei]